MTPDDKLYIFQCGHAEWNPHINKRGIKCLRCGTYRKTRYIIRICARCKQSVLLLLPKNGQARFCESCKVINARECSRRNKKKNKFGPSNIPEKNGIQYHHTLEEIGQFFGITRERARQLELIAIRKFRRNWERLHPDLPNPLDNLTPEMPQSRFMKGHVR